MSSDGSASGVRESLVSGSRIGQFVSVGVVGTAFDTTTTLGLSSVGVQPDLAKLAGAEVAIVVMFLINEHWTFAEHGAVGLLPTLRRLLKSNLVRSGGLAVQLVTYHYVRQLQVTIPVAGYDLWAVLAILVAIGTAVAVNYVAESLVTWRVHT